MALIVYQDVVERDVEIYSKSAILKSGKMPYGYKFFKFNIRGGFAYSGSAK
jgi:hypothetical protein